MLQTIELRETTEMMIKTARIEASIQALRDFDYPEEKIKKYLVSQFALLEKDAQNYLDTDPSENL